MAWEDVVTKLKFWGTRPTPADAFDPDGTQGLIGAVSRGAYAGILEFSREQKIAVLDALAEFYNNPNCTEARAVLDTAGDIWFVNTTGYGSGTVTPGNTRTLGIDFNQVSTTKWMGADGSFKAERLGGLAIHELIHATSFMQDLKDLDGVSLTAPISNGIRDYNHPNFDFLGETVRKTNLIFDQAGWDPSYRQVGYDAIIKTSNAGLLRDDPSFSYTEWNTIDIAYFDYNVAPAQSKNGTPDVLDLSQRTNELRNLIIGFGGDDRINGGAGNDYLYGSIGDDIVSGGSGDDLIGGGDRLTSLASDGIDTADYSVGDLGLQTTRGIIVSITHLLVGETFEGHKPIYVTNDGYDTTDRLLSIEKIIGTNRTDRVNVGSLNISDYGLTGKTLEFDGRLSRDVIDFSSYGGPVYLGDSKSGGGQIEVFRDKGLTDSTGLKFKSFEYVTLSSNADFVRTTVAGLEVETREGADTIYVSNGLGVNDLSAEDRVVLANLELHGGPSPQMV